MSFRRGPLTKSTETPLYQQDDPYRVSVLAPRLKDVSSRESSHRAMKPSFTPEPLSARKEPRASAGLLPELPRSSSVPRNLQRASLSAVEAFRTMLRQRYGRRGNLQMVFSEWDRGRLGCIRPEDVQSMAEKFNIAITLEEAALLVASANKSRSGVLSLEEFLELVRADDPGPASLTQDADFNAIRSSLEERAAQQRETATHTFLRQKVRSRLHYLSQAMLRKDREGRGVISFPDFLMVMDTLQLPPETVSARHLEQFFVAEGGTALGLDYRAFARNLRSNDSPERARNPVVSDYQRRLGATPSPGPAESVVLDGRVVPVHTLELLQTKSRRVKRVLKDKFASSEDFRKALLQAAGSEGIALETLRRFLYAVTDAVASRADVDALLSTVQYSAYGVADVNAIVKTIFIEEYRDDSLTRRKRGVPPSKGVQPPGLVQPSPRILTLVRELEEKLYAERCRHAFQAFRFFDTDGDGYVSREDFAKGLQRLNIPHASEEADSLLDFLDENRNGFLSYQEFASGLRLENTSPVPSVLHSAKDLYQRHCGAFMTPEKRQPEPVQRPLLRPTGAMTREVFQPASAHSIDEKARFQQKNLQPLSLASEDKERKNRLYAAKLSVIKEYRNRQNDAAAQMERAAEEQSIRKIWHKAHAVESYEKRCRISPL